MYYNTTTSQAGQDTDFNKYCSFAGGPHAKGTICYVTDKEGASSLDSEASMSLKPPSSDASKRSQPMSVALLTMLVGVSAFMLL